MARGVRQFSQDAMLRLTSALVLAMLLQFAVSMPALGDGTPAPIPVSVGSRDGVVTTVVQDAGRNGGQGSVTPQVHPASGGRPRCVWVAPIWFGGAPLPEPPGGHWLQAYCGGNG